MSPENAVWITGVGAATPLGHHYDTIADNLLAGRSGIRSVQAFDVSHHACQVAGWIDPVSCPAGWDADRFERLDDLQRLLLWCCTNALHDAGWWDRRAQVRIGLVLGSAAEWLHAWEQDGLRGGRRVYEPQQDAEPVVAMALRELGLSGPALSVSAACASGNSALMLARRWLQLGWVDVCLAGACDMAVTPMALAAFGNLRALSRRNADPQAASRPFDRGRDGFVLAEGGALFVLEKAARARVRGARPYAVVAGYGASNDAYHMVIPSPDPRQATMAMQQALANAGVSPEQVDYVNAHGTGTPVGDVAETRVLQTVFGEAVRSVPVSSTKSMTGHLLAAAAAMETLACLIAMDRRAIPPTANLDDPDPECDLCHVPHEALPRRVDIVVSNSFGFGGSNSSLVLRSPLAA